MHHHGKIWGNTATLFTANSVEVHRIEGTKGGFCSKHKHQAKCNYFFCESGALKITVWRGGLENVTTLGPKDSTTIEPGVYHKMEFLQDTVAFEIYSAVLDPGDIQRETQGGMDALPR